MLGLSPVFTCELRSMSLTVRAPTVEHRLLSSLNVCTLLRKGRVGGGEPVVSLSCWWLSSESSRLKSDMIASSDACLGLVASACSNYRVVPAGRGQEGRVRGARHEGQGGGWEGELPGMKGMRPVSRIWMWGPGMTLLEDEREGERGL
eukprot:749933-Hanusia_phi.AAC.11